MKTFCFGEPIEIWTESYNKKIEDYANYIVDPVNNKKPYVDPDTTHSNEKSEFYNLLAAFLQLVIKNKIFNFPSEKTDKNGYKVTGIQMDKNKENIVLRSDTFGFSSPNYNDKNKCWEKRYPYTLYLFKLYNDDSTIDSVMAKSIADMVARTRTIGGSFIWPICMCLGKNQNMYNMNRGVRSYIEDRVDLTLLEIKHIYHTLKIMNEKNVFCYSNDILVNRMFSNAQYMYMRDWMEIFDDFNSYTKSFIFDDFCDEENNIIDISKSTMNYEYNCKELKEIVKLSDSKDEKFDIVIRNFCKSMWNNKEVLNEQKISYNDKVIQNSMEAYEIKNMLNNICILITLRSARIINLLKSNGNRASSNIAHM